jgi:hypothetical protein
MGKKNKKGPPKGRSTLYHTVVICGTQNIEVLDRAEGLTKFEHMQRVKDAKKDKQRGRRRYCGAGFIHYPGK